MHGWLHFMYFLYCTYDHIVKDLFYLLLKGDSEIDAAVKLALLSIF